MALTRRIAAEQGVDAPDPTLVRHIYDLWAVRAHYDRSEAAALIPALMQSDAEAFGNQFPAYRENPIAATRAAIAALNADSAQERRFAAFQRDMVYGERVEFEAALAELEMLLARIDERGH